MAKKRRRALIPTGNFETRIHETGASTVARYFIVDWLRGFAILLMFIYHFIFDLSYFGAVRIDFNHDPFWLRFRAIIVSLFLVLVGVSLVLADTRGFNWGCYLRRLTIVGVCALLATLGSYLIFPDSFIFFGILHFIFVASILGLAFAKFYWVNLILGIAFVALGSVVSHSFFNQRWLQWLGLMTYKPTTQDYVPLLPWFGVVLVGMFGARLALSSGAVRFMTGHRPRNAASKVLAFAGRHSLIIYMLHQPIFIGLLWIVFRTPEG